MSQVTVTYYARDDKSGVGAVSMKLLDPQGGETHLYHYHANFHTLFFVGGDPCAWTKARGHMDAIIAPKIDSLCVS